MALELKQRKLAGLDVLEVPGDEGEKTVLCFHGWGANSYDLVPLSQVTRVRPRPTWLFPEAPLHVQITPDYVGRAWFHLNVEGLKEALAKGQGLDDLFPESLTAVREQIDQLIAELNLPLSKLFLGGFSQGAVIALDTALHAPQKCAGLILLSGTLIHAPEWQQLAPAKAGLPFFLSHGKADPILPFALAEALERLLIGAGLKGKLYPFQGGHDISTSVLIALSQFFTALK